VNFLTDYKNNNMAKNQFITGPVSYGGKAQQLAIGAGVAKAFSSGGYDSLRRDYLQDQLINQELNEFKSVYKKINTIPETGVETFDTNINAFFNQGADKIFKVKDLMANGHMTQQEGAKIIAQTEDYIDKYNLLAPKIIEQIKYYRDSKSTNKISRVNDDGLSAMLDAIANNAGGIELLEKDGKMYLTGSGKVGNQDWNYNMNLDELGGLLGQEGFAMIKTIPSYEDLGVDALFEAQKGLLKGATDTYEYTDNQGNIKTKQVYNPERLGQLMVERGLFAELINDPEMEVVWSDMVNADKELGSFQQWDPSNKDMRQTMEAFLIDKAITRNIPADEIIDVRQATSPGSKEGFNTGGGFNFAQTLFTDVAPIIKEFTELEAFDPVEGENINGEGGGMTSLKSPRTKLTPTSITLDPQRAIDLLQKYTDGQSFYTTLDANSKGDLLADAFNMIDALTEDEIETDYSEFYVEGGDLDKMKKDIKKAQSDTIERTIQSLTPNDPKSRQVVVIRKGELKPTKVEGNIYSVLKEVIENTNYISGKDVGYALNALNIFTNPNQGGFDVNRWGDYIIDEEIITDPNRLQLNTDFNTNAR
tara:strand:+ start:10078 stop:11847 length:1770 start_codon:yes stop_codon:yes gene_type:complete